MSNRFLQVLNKYNKKESNYQDLCTEVVNHVREFPNDTRELKAMDYLIRKITKSDQGIVIGDNVKGQMVLIMPEFSQVI